MKVDYLKLTPKTGLTLSAVADLLPEDAQAATSIERELEAVDAGDVAAVDRIIRYVWTESELRLMDGNR
jgi:hypothetical protein